MNRLQIVTGLGLAGVLFATIAHAQAPAPAPAAAHKARLTVHKSPSCGCCAKWVTYMTTAGFDLIVHDMDNVDPIKDQQHVPANLRSCHTAIYGGYVFEGHVPADLIQKVLKEHPKISGLAVPGMVMGSPGMEGDAKETYHVVAFDKDGKTSVYAKR
jgi:hypothetical protein